MLTPALAALALLPAAAAAGTGPGAEGRGVIASELQVDGVRAYWTPRRMRAAEPLAVPSAAEGAGAGAPEPAAGTPLLVAPATAQADPAPVLGASASGGAGAGANPPFGRDEITDPSAAEFRMHGKVFLTISGGSQPGNYVCSGTAVSSNNRSVVWTAGHCTFDDFGGGFATNWMFAPGYHEGATPFGEWVATVLAVPGQWQGGNLKYDLGAAEVAPNAQGEKLTDVVGGRGIGFSQERSQTYQSFGYPAEQPPAEFTGEREFRCTAPLGGTDNPGGSGPNTNYIECDMTGGSSGGGWVADGALLSVNSYSLCVGLICDGNLYGPYQEGVARDLYEAVAGEPLTCQGQEVTQLGTDGDDVLVGTNGRDVFKGLGGDDTIKGKKGNDRVCAGNGSDLLKGGEGKDKLKGQNGDDDLRGGKGNKDICNGGNGTDTARACETEKKIP